MVSNGVVNCELKDEVDARKPPAHDVKVHSRRPTAERVREYHLVGGHVSFGIDAVYHLSESSAQTYNVRYVTVLREPISSLISAIRFTRPRLDAHGVRDAIVARLCELSNNATRRNAVEYLSATGDFDDAAELLATRFELVGLVENWDVTMRMFAQLLDPKRVYAGWLKRERHNPSPGDFSTKDVLHGLSEDILGKLRAYCYQESRLYEIAIASHRRTCRNILSPSPSSSSSSAGMVTSSSSVPRCDCTLAWTRGKGVAVTCV